MAEAYIPKGTTPSGKFPEVIRQSVPALDETGHKRVLRMRTRCRIEHREHEPMDVVNAAIASFRTPTQSARQTEAASALVDWYSNWEGSKSGKKPITKLLQMLSELFFLGKLRKVRFAWRKGLVQSMVCLGYANWDEAEKTVAYITCDPDASWSQTDALLGIIMHECVHAFLMLYCCPSGCAGCDKDWGATAHGRAWFCLSLNIQAVARGILGKDVRLLAFRHSRDYVPCAADWEQYYDPSRSAGFVDYAWPFVDGSEPAFSELMHISLSRDRGVRDVLHRAAARHGKRDVLTILAAEPPIESSPMHKMHQV